MMDEVALTPENVKKVFTDMAFQFSRGMTKERYRQRLLEILQKDDNCRAVVVASLIENSVIRAFTWAGIKNDIEVLRAFYDVGMDINVQTAGGSCALWHASWTGQEESVRWLLEHNANVDVLDSSGWTPLMGASRNGKTAVAKLLLQQNANGNIQNKDGRTALMIASKEGCQEVIDLLLCHNVDVDLKDNDGDTALDMAKNDEIKEMFENYMNSYLLK